MRDLVVKIFASIGLYKPIVEIINKAKFEIQARRMRKNGLAMLAAADAVFTKLGVRAFLTYGALLGYKKQLFMACENLSEDFIEQWSVWLNTPISPLQSYLEASLSNSNPLLHPARLYGMWHNWNGQVYPEQELFYAHWDKYSSEIYITMDNEFQQLCKKLNVSIQPVLEYYESLDAESLTRKLNSIEAFKTILAPMIRTEEGWIPDLNSRYFTEDFPYGLLVIKDLAVKKNIATPTIDKVLIWGKQFI